MRIVAIIQARMGSSRRPGKVMADLAGKPMLYHVVSRAQQARSIDLVVVATSDQSRDDVIDQFCSEVGVPCFRGSEDDVLDRYYQAAKQYEAEVIVRLTADCPLLDPAVIEKVVQVFRNGDHDYVSNALEPTYPDGLDTEIFWRTALERTWREAKLKTDREYATAYIWRQPQMFRLTNVRNDVDLSALRWTVDEPEDLEFVQRVYEYLGPEPSFGMTEILALLHEHPELKDINATFERNEGYQRSVQEEKEVK